MYEYVHVCEMRLVVLLSAHSIIIFDGVLCSYDLV